MLGKILLLIVAIIGLVITVIFGLFAGLGVFLYALLAFIFSFFGLIPVIGPVFYWLLMAYVTEPFIATIVPLGPWNAVIYWIFFLFSLGYCLFMSFMAFVVFVMIKH